MSIHRESDGTDMRIGTASASRTLIDRLEPYRPYLNLIARKRLSSRISRHKDVEDIVQETLCIALKNWHRFRGNTEPELAAWLRQILVRRIIDAARSGDASDRRNLHFVRQNDSPIFPHVNGSPSYEFATDSTPSKLASRREMAVVVAQALEQLPSDYREAIRLRHWEHLCLSGG